jgi:hypothetical protein
VVPATQQPFQRRLQQVLAVGAVSCQRDGGAHEVLAALGQQSLNPVAWYLRR